MEKNGKRTTPQKNHLIKFDKNTLFNEILIKLGRERNFLNLIKGICEKPIGSIILNDVRLNISPYYKEKGKNVHYHHLYCTGGPSRCN